ncbi:50S ribosomal protein L11 methyltransferase [Aetokthonos hydrillicola Thurmond2011]|jgi:ribosomal protein L11 methyltransferase|uniref:50S ribosomal protein L11 methyltransferase n=1 Tax=Aetokthonos hydrillicola Thurmond2011 TaxID=2712845 RepID=A0AAP5I6B4_9CYAN|nr:50S ribosomal protein L11 methyltransferase [Aetokthonos hydrillicola]MBW4583683.1 50S ribosomal protein L11 methyltransferase [Aetokthonos hydrillicola CCALA 1050]MDR9895621.1 50S ribosomal protein L11 methyltransferase [Aetokthonos hydrillicola Thurmond2011]
MWNKLSINTTQEAVDWVCSLLAKTNYSDDIRVTKCVQADQNQSSQNDIESNFSFTICLYLPNDTHINTNVENITNLLSPLHRTKLISTLETTLVEDKPAQAGINNSLVHRIGKRFVVLSPDTSYDSEATNEVTLKLRTNFAFGSGFHPATILSLRMLERHIIPNMNVLDLGCGSGILSVAMAKLGANVLALDNDSVAVQATRDALRLNEVEQQVTVMEGSLGSGSDLGHWMGRETLSNVPTINPTASFDLIVANILPWVHISLADDFVRSLRKTTTHTGLVITAGFTNDYQDDVSTALVQSGLELVDCEILNEWVALAHGLKA